MPRGGARPGAGRPKGSIPKDQSGVEAFARSIVEDATYQTNFKTRAKQGQLAPVLETMLYYYAYGKPVEQSRDDQVFMEDLLAVVLKHVGSHAARQEIRAVLEAHEFSATRLSAVA